MEEPETGSVLANAAVQIAMTAEELVERVGQIEKDDYSRRLALGAARSVERLAAALVEEPSRVETSTGQPGHKRAP